MKLLLFTDNHFCEKSSIIQKYGTKYSIRLENQIASLNWVEEQAIIHDCKKVICLGDFFDKPELNEQEITALKDIKWNSLPHYFIVGNHESRINTLQYSSAKVLETDNHYIIDQPAKINFPETSCEFCFLPYIIESDRLDIKDYFGEQKQKNRVILSHNDLKGIQLGPIMSKNGFSIEDIENNCDLFLNGHLHNGKAITKKLINLGNLTGKDFGEDATKYTHNILILDTESLQYELIENPYAFNFYKIEIKNTNDLLQLNSLKDQAVLSIKCTENLIKETRSRLELLSKQKKIVEYRIIVSKDLADTVNSEDISDLTVDHLAKFIEFCKVKINNTDVLEQELSEICK